MTDSDRPAPEPEPDARSEARQPPPRAATCWPVLPLRDIVVFPHMIVPLFVGREKSVRALEEVMKDDKQILLVTQKNAAQDDPSADDIYRVGTVSHGAAAAEAAGRHGEGAGRGRPARATSPASRETDSVLRGVRRADARRARRRARSSRRSAAPWSSQFEQYIKLNKKIAARGAGLAQPDRGAVASSPTRSPAHLTLKIAEKQELLEIAERRRAAGAGVRATWRPRSACCRSRSASAAASSGRWRRPSASTT